MPASATTLTVVTNKRRGRPRKHRKGAPPRAPDPAPPPVSRRSSRCPRRLLREDYYNQDDVVVESDDDGDERRSSKKLKLLLKLHHHNQHSFESPSSDPDSRAWKRRRRRSRSSDSYSSESAASVELDGGGLDGSDDGGAGRRGSGDGDDKDQDECRYSSQNCGAPACVIGTPLPELKTLTTILDRLQKKDRYSVFAQPVDPEELPDYHEVIEHPMDFDTVRKKLAGHTYTNFEQFENDVLLICSNAMRYNAPDTVYFRQARSIQELAKKKFEAIRVESSCHETILKSLQKDSPNSVAEKPVEKSICNSPKKSDLPNISSEAFITSNGNFSTELKETELIEAEESAKENEIVDGSSLPCESLSDKTEELSENIILNHEKKSFLVDENRRATYNLSIKQPFNQDSSVFATFQNEEKDLIDVGLHSELSYATSLARFSATLGPIAWKIASEKIANALPAGINFGPGWVGEYEPLPRPVIFSKRPLQQSTPYGNTRESRLNLTAVKEIENVKIKNDAFGKNMKVVTAPVNSQVTDVYGNRVLNPFKGRSSCAVAPERKENFIESTRGCQLLNRSEMTQWKRDKSSDSVCANIVDDKGNSMTPKTLVSFSPKVDPTDASFRRSEHFSKVAVSTSLEMAEHKNQDFSYSVNKPGLSMLEREHPCTEAGRLPEKNGRSNSCGASLEHKQYITSKPASLSTLNTTDDPARLTRVLPDKLPCQQNFLNACMADGAKQFTSSVLSPRNYSGAAGAAQTCLPFGASAEHKSARVLGHPVPTDAPLLYRPAWLLPHSGHRGQDIDKKSPSQQILPLNQQITVEESGVQSKGLAVFPHFTTELPKCHGQRPWQGLISHTTPWQNKEMLPPDLNICFQPPGSPVRLSSGILVDSQQPDLALQL